MALAPYRYEQLNYFKFASIFLDEFPKALRHTFKSMWDNTFAYLPGYQLWDDSITVRDMLRVRDGGARVPAHHSYDEWDCTALFSGHYLGFCTLCFYFAIKMPHLTLTAPFFH